MRYIGGKSRLGKEIGLILKQYRKHNQPYIEPFIGSAGVFQHMESPKLGSDLDEDIVSFLTALRDGWIPPKHVSEEMYNQIKNNEITCSPQLRGFVAYGCSFGGKKWGGYARGEDRDYAYESYKSALKLQLKIKDSEFLCCDYSELNPENALIYCDPPYKNTTDYPYLESFNHRKFWGVVRRWSENNTVIVSEYTAPEDFTSIWEKSKTTTIDKKSKVNSIEKLFMIVEVKR